jgi:hypothetical protein
MAAADEHAAWAPSTAVAPPPQQRDAHSRAGRAPHRDADISAAIAGHDWRGVRDALACTFPAATAGAAAGGGRACVDEVLLELQRLLFLKAAARDTNGERFASCASVDVAWRAVRAAAC